MWYEDGRREQREAPSEEKLAAKLDKVKLRLKADAPKMRQLGAALIAHYLDPGRLPADKRWSRKHAHTQERLCQRFAAPVIATVTCQDIRTGHMQEIVNAAPTAGEGDRVRGMVSALVTAGMDAGNRGGRHELMANAAAYNGLRWGELTALTVAQVDRSARVIAVDRKVVEVAGHLFVEAPKNRKHRRTVYPVRTPGGYPLAERLAVRIEEAIAEQEAGTNPLGLVFPSPRGKHWRGGQPGDSQAPRGIERGRHLRVQVFVYFWHVCSMFGSRGVIDRWDGHFMKEKVIQR